MILDRIEEARKRGIWLEIETVGYSVPKAAEGYKAKARWAHGNTLFHVGFNMEEAVNAALNDAEAKIGV